MATPRRANGQTERRAGPLIAAPLTPRLLLEDAARRYAGEWLLMRILSFNPGGDPVDGLLLAHSPRRRVISQALAKQPKRRGDAAGTAYYIFRAPEEPLSAERFDAAANRLLHAQPASPGA